uniref:USP domain-containing protein n=1 Tax=Strongyloides venezuelensis TaxID=75913 RepID=A0A0K0FZF1_STRVS
MDQMKNVKICSETVYTEAFSYLKRILYIEHKAVFSSDEWIVGRRYAVINSIKNTFEIAQEKISLCFFHYSNAFFREINSFEKEIIEVYKKIKLDFDDLCNSGDLEDVVVGKVKKLFDYFQKRWIYSNILLSSLFELKIAHLKLNSLCYFSSLKRRTYWLLDAMINKLQDNYDSKEITTENYLYALSRLLLCEKIMDNLNGLLSLYNSKLEDNICEVFDPSTQQNSLENEQTPNIYPLRKIPQLLKHANINGIINSGLYCFTNSSIQVIIKIYEVINVLKYKNSTSKNELRVNFINFYNEYKKSPLLVDSQSFYSNEKISQFFVPPEMHDVCDFMEVFLDKLNEELRLEVCKKT